MQYSLAGIAQLVEYKLPKLGVAGSNPVARSINRLVITIIAIALSDVLGNATSFITLDCGRKIKK